MKSPTLLGGARVGGKAGTHVLVPPSSSSRGIGCVGRRRKPGLRRSVALLVCVGVFLLLALGRWGELGRVVGGLRRVDASCCCGWGREGVGGWVIGFWWVALFNHVGLVRRDGRKGGVVARTTLVIVRSILGFAALFTVSTSSICGKAAPLQLTFGLQLCPLTVLPLGVFCGTDGGGPGGQTSSC